MLGSSNSIYFGGSGRTMCCSLQCNGLLRDVDQISRWVEKRAAIRGRMQTLSSLVRLNVVTFESVPSAPLSIFSLGIAFLFL